MNIQVFTSEDNKKLPVLIIPYSVKDNLGKPGFTLGLLLRSNDPGLSKFTSWSSFLTDVGYQ